MIRTIVYMRMVIWFYRTDNWKLTKWNLWQSFLSVTWMSAAFLLTIIPANLTKFLYYPANMQLMQLLCLKHGSTARYWIQIFHWLDRNRNGGGVLAFVKSNIYCIRRFDLESPNVQVLWLEMCLEKSISFILAVCYQPPHTNAQFLQLIFRVLGWFNLLAALGITEWLATWVRQLYQGNCLQGKNPRQSPALDL